MSGEDPRLTLIEPVIRKIFGQYPDVYNKVADAFTEAREQVLFFVLLGLKHADKTVVSELLTRVLISLLVVPMTETSPPDKKDAYYTVCTLGSIKILESAIRAGLKSTINTQLAEGKISPEDANDIERSWELQLNATLAVANATDEDSANDARAEINRCFSELRELDEARNARKAEDDAARLDAKAEGVQS